MVTYDHFYGREVGSQYILLYQYKDKNSTLQYVPLYHGDLFDFDKLGSDFSTTVVPGGPVVDGQDTLQLSFTYTSGSWPTSIPGSVDPFPVPLPWSPKFPQRLIGGLPYGSETDYKALIDTLQAGIALRDAYDEVKIHSETTGHDLEAARDAIETAMDTGGNVDQARRDMVEQARTWLLANMGSGVMTNVQAALPAGLPRGGMVEQDLSDWEPLGWEVRVVAGFIDLLAVLRP